LATTHSLNVSVVTSALPPSEAFRRPRSWAGSAIFYPPARIPLLWALGRIRGGDIHFGRSCGAPDHHATNPPRVSRADLFKDRRLLIFTICLFLFQLANASLLPLIGQALTRAEGRSSSLVVSALIVLPQIIVALLAPWAGRTANTWGRRPLLLIGLAVVPIRSGLFALTTDPVLLIVTQLLDGLSGATLGVLTTLIIADLTTGTGRLNLALGFAGAASGVGASLSTSIFGIVAQRFGYTAGLLGITAVGLVASRSSWLLCRRRDHQLFGRSPGFVTLPGRTRLARQQTKRGPRESDLLVRGFA
jgi:MFS family permease